MIIPTAVQDRDQLYDEVAQACIVSRNDRIAFYERMRSYYLWGCDGSGDPATFNKIFPQVDQVASFVFGAETTRFGITLGESADPKIELPKVPALSRRVNARWSDSNCDILFGMALRWSMVYGSMFLKLIQRGPKNRNRTIPYIVEPHSFGVYREDVPFLSDQEAFVHTYQISEKVLDHMLIAHPRRAQIMASVVASMKQSDHDSPQGVQRIIMSTQAMTGYPNGPGQINNLSNIMQTYRARTVDERVEMRELWIWDDDLNDYRVVTLASGSVYIYDRQNFWLPGDHPFTQVCPYPCYDYLWGAPIVDKLTRLQDLREGRLEQIVELLNRQVKPATSQRGNWQGIPDETNYASQVFGGGMASSDPTADFKTYFPTVPQDTYAEVREIDAMFNEMTSLPNVTQGKGEPGVRAKGHAAELARLGSSRIKNTAFTVEDSLDRLGTQYLKAMQIYEKDPLTDDNGQKFIARQFTGDAVVKVDAHSSSPIFIEDQKALANELFEARAIDRAEFIEIKNPPNKQVMLANLKKIERAEAAAAEAERKAELAQKGLKAVK